jgi:hypothetical protein
MSERTPNEAALERSRRDDEQLEAEAQRFRSYFKTKPHLLEVMKKQDDREALDKKESAKVRGRSKGRCEVRVGGERCAARAFEVHHHLGGWKLRGRGESALAKNKTHCCSACHRLITGNVLEHLGGNRYRRLR